MMKTNLVLIGHGYWGQNIARNLAALGALYGVLDVTESARATAEQRYPDARLFTSYEAVLADPNVHAVAISTPAETHATLAIQAMEAGKDVFVEKPLALTHEDGLRMHRAAQTHQRILMVGHLLEYHPAILALEALIQSGELGKIQYVYSNRLNLGKFRREENILWSFAPHDIAIMLRLIGASPIEVFASGGTYLQPNIADTTITSLLFDQGVRGHIFVSWLHPYKEQKLVVVGSQKMAVFDDQQPFGEKLVLFDKGAEWVNNAPVPRQGAQTFVTYADAERLRSELGHFIECVQTRNKPVTDALNGLRVLQVLQAAQFSLQTGGTRVPLWNAFSEVS